MHNDPRKSADPFSGLVANDRIGPVEYDVSVPASDRYWQAAGIHHPARTAGFLYPPMAANLTMLALLTAAHNPLLHTHQALECHQAVCAPATLTVSGSVTGRFERRGREYLEVTVEITAAGEPVWTSVATFIAAGESDPDPAPGREQ